MEMNQFGRLEELDIKGLIARSRQITAITLRG
jgi:hypothetical protein